ncbi:hypothetical protein CLI64_20075 [Nostoc sp. CENA543]|uniref:hypothetical protein n=1 Tax=Nostoc sp. CENA543 TaxID=1869241 RepID=UPI000CA0F7B8|nr:hypothetical protein [Nostoc sp. CENA543]AUT02502.1 hypothetical protein CLI64_20075 [Nostoc sp. CENA543]
MYQNINISLPEETIELIDQILEKDDPTGEKLHQRSQLINEAIQYYLAEKTLTKLEEQLKAGAIQRAERDLGLVSEWYDLEEEAWNKNGK